MDELIKWGIGALAAYGAATFGSKALTGKHLHTHAYAWYSRIRDKIAAWFQKYPEMKGAQLGLTVLYIADNAVNAMLRARDAMKSKTKEGMRYAGKTFSALGAEEENREVVQEEEFSLDDLPFGFGIPPMESVQTDVEDVEEIVEAETATVKPGHVLVAISAAKGGVHAQITEEEIPISELGKMFPQAQNAPLGRPIPITL